MTIEDVYIKNNVQLIDDRGEFFKFLDFFIFLQSKIRHEDFRPSFVTYRLPPLDSETGWTGELWSKTNLLIWQN